MKTYSSQKNKKVNEFESRIAAKRTKNEMKIKSFIMAKRTNSEGMDAWNVFSSRNNGIDRLMASLFYLFSLNLSASCIY